jgi:hypothetical protein
MNFRSGNVHTFSLSLGTEDTVKGSSNYTIAKPNPIELVLKEVR